MKPMPAYLTWKPTPGVSSVSEVTIQAFVASPDDVYAVVVHDDGAIDAIVLSSGINRLSARGEGYPVRTAMREPASECLRVDRRDVQCLLRMGHNGPCVFDDQCPDRLDGGMRCTADVGHDGDHRHGPMGGPDTVYWTPKPKPVTAPCPDGDSCPDARRFGSIHPAPKP